MLGRERSLWFYHFLMLVSAGLVSTSFGACAAVADAVDPLVLTFYRFLLAAVFLAPVIAFNYSLRVPVGLVLRASIVSGALVLFFWCMFLSLRYTTALNTSVIFATVPFISWVYSALLGQEVLGSRRGAALLLGLMGALWVIFRGDPGQLISLDFNRGDLIFLAGCFFNGMYTPLIKHLYRGEPMVQFTFWILVTGTCWLALFGGAEIASVDWSGVAPATWGWLAYLALFTTVITFFLTQYSILFLGPTRVMAYSYLYPSFVLLIDLALGKGWPPARILPGIAMVFMGMVILQLSADKVRPGRRAG